MPSTQLQIIKLSLVEMALEEKLLDAKDPSLIP